MVLIKSQKDFYSGLMFAVVGAAFALGSTNYSIGTAARMGPGYFPLVLGILLALLGVGIAFKPPWYRPKTATRWAAGAGGHCFSC